MKPLSEIPIDYIVILILLIVLCIGSMGRIIYLVITSGKLPDFLEASENDETDITYKS
nr:hypothetical protein [uncultured Draconibacterium sp.]